MRDDPGGLVEQAYAAALDESLLPRWAEQALLGFGGIGGLFVVLGPDGMVPDRVFGLWPDTISPDDYFNDMVRYDPQVGYASSLTRSTIYRDCDHLDEGRPDTRAYMAWQRAGGFDHHMTALAVLGDGTTRAAISMHRAPGDGPFGATDQAALRALFPQVARAWELGFHHGELLQAAFWEGIAAREGDRAALLIDEGGGMLHATDAALALLASGDGIALTAGRLRCERAQDAGHLRAVIGRATRRADALSGAMRIARRSGRAPYLLVAYPLARSRRMLAPAEAAALVTITDPARSLPTPAALLRDAFGLTAREGDLARLIAAGHSVESAAAVLAIAMPTARLHLRRVFAKTATSRQAELVRLLAAIG